MLTAARHSAGPLQHAKPLSITSCGGSQTWRLCRRNRAGPCTTAARRRSGDDAGVQQDLASDSGAPALHSDRAASTASRTAALAGTLVAVAAAAALLARSGLSVQQAVQELEDVVASAGSLGPALFVGAYVLSTVLLFPASLLTLGAGFLFGPLQGTVLVSAASTLGATSAFLISRYLARPWVEDKLHGYPRFKDIDEGVSRDGARIVFLLRLSPLLPFNLLNYGLGVTKVPFRDYLFASWAGMLPGTFAYVYAGSVGKAAVTAAGEASGAGADGFEGVKIILWVAGAVATLAAVKLISDAASRALNSGSSRSRDETV